MEKKLGILGGMGPMATIEFAKLIVEKSPAKLDQEHIPMMISNNPQIPDRTEFIIHSGKNPLDAMLKELEYLKLANVTQVVIPCNTAHYWIEKLKVSGLPFLSIIDSTIEHILLNNIKKVGILATEATIKSKIFENSVTEDCLEFLIPNTSQQILVSKGIKAVKAGNLKEGCTYIEPIFDELITRGAESVILGCTEIPLAFSLLPPEKISKTIDTLDILAEKCVSYYYS